jgi:glutathione S-transferase
MFELTGSHSLRFCFLIKWGSVILFIFKENFMSEVMQLIGSTTSPFVRRTRLLLSDVEHDFVSIDIFSPQGRKVLKNNNPANKIPILVDGDHTVFDSRIIFNYVAEKLALTPLTWQQQNLLTMIDAINDSLVTLFLCKKSGLDTNADVMFFKLQQERVETVLIALNDEINHGNFDHWQYPEICLFCLLDWIEFRQLAQWQHLSGLTKFYQRVQGFSGTAETDPR